MRYVLLLLAFSFLLAGCTEFAPAEKPDQQELQLCAADVMVCPDGTLVSRDPANDCEYKKCSEEGYGDTTEGWRAEG